jgi:type VI protein secretion system component Hcp
MNAPQQGAFLFVKRSDRSFILTETPLITKTGILFQPAFPNPPIFESVFNPSTNPIGLLMKPFLLAACLLLFAFCQDAAAQKILMKITNITPAAGEEVKALDFRINASSSYTKGGGASIGRPAPDSLIIKKAVDKSTSDLLKKIVAGSAYPEVIFEYYDNNNVNYYTITLTGALVTSLYWLSPECPTCLKLEQQLSFVMSAIKMEDKITKATVTYNISAMTIN